MINRLEITQRIYKIPGDYSSIKRRLCNQPLLILHSQKAKTALSAPTQNNAKIQFRITIHTKIWKVIYRLYYFPLHLFFLDSHISLHISDLKYFSYSSDFILKSFSPFQKVYRTIQSFSFSFCIPNFSFIERKKLLLFI